MKNLNTALFFLCAVSLLPVLALARPGGGLGTATTGLLDEGSKGLCTSDSENSTENWVKDGWCKQIMDVMTKEECGKEDFAKLQEKAKQGQIKDLELSCSSISSKAADKMQFAGVIQQIVAALVIEESSWDPKISGPDITADGRTGPNIHPGESTDNAVGLMQLSVSSVGKYQCCQDIKSKADLQDPKKSLKCGTQIAIHWMQEDGELGGGSGKNARGIARYFQPYREIDKIKRERMQKKVNGYCARDSQPDAGSLESLRQNGRQ